MESCLSNPKNEKVKGYQAWPEMGEMKDNNQVGGKKPSFPYALFLSIWGSYQERTQGENAPGIESWYIIYRVTQSIIFMFFPLCKIALYILLSLLNG